MVQNCEMVLLLVFRLILTNGECSHSAVLALAAIDVF